MLEKIKRNINVAKLRSILPLESDINGTNKIICNPRVLSRFESCRAIPYEVIGCRRGKYSQHIALNKKLVCDIGNKTTRPIVVISADTTNFYDRIVHLVASITNQQFGVQLEYLFILFSAARSIKIFLRKIYKVSQIFYTGSKDMPFQGAVQGNGATPPIWIILSISLFFYSYYSNLVPVHNTQISLAAYQMESFLYVDDADFVALNNGTESATELVGRA